MKALKARKTLAYSLERAFTPVSMLFAAILMLSGCAWKGEAELLSRPKAPTPPQPGGHLVVIDGRLVEEPPTPIETVIEGMEQAQKLKTLARRLPK